MQIKLENAIQQEIFIWFSNEYARHGKGLIFSCPNGGFRDAREGKTLKNTGLLAGVSDLIILLPNAITIFIEVKRPGKNQTPEQVKFMNDVRLLGFQYFIVRSLQEFKYIIQL